MKRSRIFSLLAASTLLGGSFAIAQGMAQDAPQAAPQAEASAEATVTTPATPPPFHDLRRITPVRGDVEAGRGKSEVCSACHGPEGVAIAPIFPNLAGQRATYLYWELVEYHQGGMPESPMAPLAATLNDTDMRDLAQYYASLPPGRAPVEEGAAPPDAAVLERGQQLFMEGDPAKGIPACQGCHGPDAKGHPLADQLDRNGQTPWATYPALRSQNAPYLEARLTAFREDKLHNSTTDKVMNGVGVRLEESDIKALSTWLAQLSP